MSGIYHEIHKKLQYRLSKKGIDNMERLIREGEMKEKIILTLNTNKSNFILDDKGTNMIENKQDKTFIDTGFFKWNGEFSLLPTIAVIIYLSALLAGHISWWTLPLIIVYKMDFITVDVAKFFPKATSKE